MRPQDAHARSTGQNRAVTHLLLPAVGAALVAVVAVATSLGFLPQPLRYLAPVLVQGVIVALCGRLGGQSAALVAAFSATAVTTVSLLAAAQPAIDPFFQLPLLLLATGLAVAALSRRSPQPSAESPFLDAPVGMAQLSADGLFVDVNRQLCAITGYTPAELRERARAVLVSPEDQPSDREWMNQLLAGTGGSSIEQRWIRKDGCTIWVRLSLSAPRGASATRIAVVEEITLRKQSESSLRASEDRLQLAMQIAECGTWDIDLLDDRTIWSHSVFHLLGIEPRANGVSDWRLWLEAVHPADRETVMAEWQRADQSRSVYRALHRIIRRNDGQTRWFDAAGRFFYDSSGKAVRFIGVLFDVTAHRFAEELLRSSEERFRALAEAVPSLLFVSNAQGLIEFVNPRYYEYTGLSAEQVLGRGWERILHPDDRAATLRNWNAAVAAGEAFEAEHRFCRADGEYRWFVVRAVPVRDAGDSRILRWFGAAADIEEQKRIEAALRESEARFRKVADHAPVMIWITEPDGTCSYLSRTWYEFTGRTEEGGLGYGWLDAVHPDDRERTHLTFQQARLRRESFRIEYRLRRADGRWRWAIDTAAPRTSPDGSFLGFIGSVIDITERKESEESARRREAELRAIANAVPALVWAWAPGGKLLYANDSWYRFTGHDPDAAAASPESWLSALHPDDADRIRHSWQQDDPSGAHLLTETELRVRGNDGTFHWHAFRALPQRNAANVIEKWFGVGVDIDEARRTQEALRESETQFRQIAEAAPLGVWVSDAGGAVEYFSRHWYALTGQTEEEALANNGSGWAKAIHPDDLPRCLDVWTEAVREGIPYRNEVRVRRHDGIYRWVHGQGLPVKDASGRILRWVGANVEIHDQKEAEITLRRANHDLKQFVWAASHDLQEPLRMVVTFTSLLHQQFASSLDPQSVEFARFAVEGASRMQVLLKGLRDYWAASERVDDPPDLVPLERVVDAALGNLNTSIAETSAEVNADPLPVVIGSHTPLVQLFQNLISNALKYRHSERRPRIAIRASRQGFDWLLCVEDNGIGIAPQYHEQVFGIFKRLHRSSEYSGSGIGLALCRTIVERHGGRIWLESQLDVGTRFYFTLPAAGQSASAESGN